VAVPSAAARMVHSSGPNDSRPGRRSDAFRALHRTVRALGRTIRDGAGSSSSSQKPRSRPWEEILGCSGLVGHPGRP
jgi:hypothetical protein